MKTLREIFEANLSPGFAAECTTMVRAWLEQPEMIGLVSQAITRETGSMAHNVVSALTNAVEKP